MITVHRVTLSMQITNAHNAITSLLEIQAALTKGDEFADARYDLVVAVQKAQSIYNLLVKKLEEMDEA